MEIRRIFPVSVSQDQFLQIVRIEEACGLEPYTPEMLLDCIDNLDTYACFDGENVAGFITIHPYSRYFGGSIYIVNLNVAREYRRRGIGQALIRFACVQYPADRMVSLDVCKSNAPALGLYRKLGFAVSDLPSRNGDMDIVMKRKNEDWNHDILN